MKIYTKTGDGGTSGLLTGERLGKESEIFEVLGDLDELNAALGMIAVEASGCLVGLSKVQSALFDIGAELAGEPGDVRFEAGGLAEMVRRMEAEIDEWTEGLPPLRNFILPGGSRGSAAAHVARVVCRRAERRVVGWSRDHVVRDEVRQFLNRLSDWLFTLARRLNQDAGVADVDWRKER